MPSGIVWSADKRAEILRLFDAGALHRSQLMERYGVSPKTLDRWVRERKQGKPEPRGIRAARSSSPRVAPPAPATPDGLHIGAPPTPRGPKGNSAGRPIRWGRMFERLDSMMTRRGVPKGTWVLDADDQADVQAIFDEARGAAIGNPTGEKAVKAIEVGFLGLQVALIFGWRVQVTVDTFKARGEAVEQADRAGAGAGKASGNGVQARLPWGRARTEAHVANDRHDGNSASVPADGQGVSGGPG
jgi:hypothetical protein